MRERDSRCVITGFKYSSWTALQAAHVFPLAHASYWNINNYGRWITTDDPSGSINSVQNGILLRADIHQLFDAFAFSINPDVGDTISFYNVVADY